MRIHNHELLENAYSQRLQMKCSEFSAIRKRLIKTQKEMANILGTSLKAVQSFEQGWRNIPLHIERQMLFLLAMKASLKGIKSCWVQMKCPSERRKNCPAWEFKCGNLCWFINGTICHGETQKNWKEKMIKCQKCKVFRAIVS